ncbi:MAG: hypothetical protein DMF23_07610 [Verrucomicrobia bacterium]|nr:MAG: hypothetical protein DMF23_07610 [Verrucomicrobiota bacterium]
MDPALQNCHSELRRQRGTPKVRKYFEPCEVPRFARDDGALKEIDQFHAHALARLRHDEANIPKKFLLSRVHDRPLLQ